MAQPERPDEPRTCAKDAGGTFYHAPPARSRKSLLPLAALVAGLIAAVCLWSARAPETAPAGTPSAPADKPPAASASNPPLPPAPSVQAPGPVDVTLLCGSGASIADFLKHLEKASGLRLVCELTGADASRLQLRLSAYEGDPQLPFSEALDLLKFADLIAGQPLKSAELRVRRSSAEETVWRQLLGPADPMGTDWGALCAWQTVSLTERSTTVCTVESDGRITVRAEPGTSARADAGAIANLAGVLSASAGKNTLERAAALAALCQAEASGRNLDETALGREAWEARRNALQTVREWLASAPVRDAALQENVLFTAAWLQAACVLHPAVEPQFIAALQDRLWQSGDVRAQLLAADFGTAGKRAASSAAPVPVRLAAIAGRSWTQNRMTCEDALEFLNSADPRFRRAVLWRLARPEPHGAWMNPSDTMLQSLAARVEDLLNEPGLPSQRRWALAALYCEHRRKNADGSQEPWRFRWEPDLAIKLFLAEDSLSIQQAAAIVLGQLASPAEISLLAQTDLSARAPEALVQFLSALTGRWALQQTPREVLAPAVMNLAGVLSSHASGEVAAKAAFLRMQEPDLTPLMRLRVVGSFKNAAARASAVKALALNASKDTWEARDLLHLASDKSPQVRQALFESRVPLCGSPAEKQPSLFAKGLADDDAGVRLAALKALSGNNLRALEENVRRLAQSDPNGEIRTWASKLLNSR